MHQFSFGLKTDKRQDGSIHSQPQSLQVITH